MRPAPVGTPVPHKVRAAYAGITGQGTSAASTSPTRFYEAFGRDSFNPIPPSHKAQHINAQLAALELAYERTG